MSLFSWHMQEDWRGKRVFAMTCQHGQRVLDRISEVRGFLSKHNQCNPDWEPWVQRPSETDREHCERLKETFPFSKAGTAFEGFPDIHPSATPKAKKQQDGSKAPPAAAVPSKRRSPVSHSAPPAKRKPTSPNCSNAAGSDEPAKRKSRCPDSSDAAGSVKLPKGKPSCPDSSKPTTSAKPAKKVSQKPAAASQQNKASKWAEKLQKVEAPQPADSGRPEKAAQKSLAVASWDKLPAEDISVQLHQAAEEFEVKKTGYSMSIE
jgi:hypothetical protein